MKQHKLFWGSSYDRELDILLFMWPDIIKKFPDAELHVCYGWDLYDKASGSNAERRQWKLEVQKMMGQKGIKHHGRVGKKELAKIRRKCGIWAYPTAFNEICCITALDCQADGVVPVTMTLAALDETVGSGIKIKGNIKNTNVVQPMFLRELLSLMGDEKRWKEESKKAIKFAKNYTWPKIADKWVDCFKEPVKQPLVSVITCTNRMGWWNIMAHNLSKQTYKNFEWIIVDDFKKNRVEVAKKYADKYKLKIRYIRGKREVKRRYGLSSANNCGWKSAKGELCIYLQDFMLLPGDSIETMVDIYRHNPDALIAPVDMYYYPKVKPDTSKEDWFNGKIDIIGKYIRKNIRITGEGMRESDHEPDFEMNVGAIPKKILQDLNGFWEFFDEALGYDNTEIAYRALKAGYKIIVDDTNVAIGLDHWKALKDKPEQLGKDRGRHMNDPRYFWMIDMMKLDKIPLRRTQEIDNKIDLQYTIPKEVKGKDCPMWLRDNLERIIKKWLNK